MKLLQDKIFNRRAAFAPRISVAHRNHPMLPPPSICVTHCKSISYSNYLNKALLRLALQNWTQQGATAPCSCCLPLFPEISGLAGAASYFRAVASPIQPTISGARKLIGGESTIINGMGIQFLIHAKANIKNE